MFGGSKLHLRFLLLMNLAVVLTVAIRCQPPLTPSQCAAAFIRCYSYTESECIAAGGTFRENAGSCGYCNVCAVYVGLNERCNTILRTFGSEGAPVTTVCRSPLVCLMADGACVNPSDCEYQNV